MIADHGVIRAHAHRGCNPLPLLSRTRPDFDDSPIVSVRHRGQEDQADHEGQECLSTLVPFDVSSAEERVEVGVRAGSVNGASSRHRVRRVFVEVVAVSRGLSCRRWRSLSS
jgi:hypothetical protein